MTGYMLCVAYSGLDDVSRIPFHSVAASPFSLFNTRRRRIDAIVAHYHLNSIRGLVHQTAHSLRCVLESAFAALSIR